MAHDGLKPKEVGKIHSVLTRYPQVRKAVLYGSRAMGTHRLGSDIDLTLVGKELKFPELARIETELDDLLLPYQIDLSIYHQIDNQSLLNHIERVGVLFFERADQTDKEKGLKNGWKTCELAKHIKLIDYRGRTPKKTESGVRLITAKNVKLGYLQRKPEEFIAEDNYEEWMRRGIPNHGDVIFTTEAPLANVAQLDTHEKVAFAQRTIVMQPDLDVIQQTYLKYLLLSPDVREDIFSNGTGATVTGIKSSLLKKIQIPIPPLSEQEEIVDVLDKAFAAIDQAKANIEQNIANAKEFFQSKLNQIFSQKGEGWVETTLEDVCEITSKLCDPRENEYLDLLHVGGANIESQTGALIKLQTAREEGLKSGKFPFDDSMVLYSKIRPYLEKVARPSFEGLCSADIYPLTPNDGDLTRDFLFHLLLTPDFTDYAIEGSGRAGMPKVNRKHLFAYSFFVPPLPEQKDISDQLDALSESTNQLEAHYQTKLASLDELKKSILQKAFAGELT